MYWTKITKWTLWPMKHPAYELYMDIFSINDRKIWWKYLLLFHTAYNMALKKPKEKKNIFKMLMCK